MAESIRMAPLSSTEPVAFTFIIIFLSLSCFSLCYFLSAASALIMCLGIENLMNQTLHAADAAIWGSICEPGGTPVCYRVIADGWGLFFFLVCFACFCQSWSNFWTLKFAHYCFYPCICVCRYERVPILSGDLFSDIGDKTSLRKTRLDGKERTLTLTIYIDFHILWVNCSYLWS